jgi:flagellin FlaB
MFTIKKLVIANGGAIGIGSMIIFIALLLIAGVAASVLIQTANNLQNQALETGRDTLKEVANGIKVTHISGKTNGDNITEFAIFIETISASDEIDLEHAHIELSDDNKKVIMRYDSNYFNESVASGGLFDTMDLTGLSATSFGIIVVRDNDDSCESTRPIINGQDMVVLMVNVSSSFGNGSSTSGIGTRTEVQGGVYPEFGMRGVINFYTPSVFVDTIIDLR